MTKQLAGIYTRFSTSNQTQNSTETQVQGCLAYCQKNNIEVYKIYSDEETTGYNTNRKYYTKLLEDIRAKKINIVVIYDVTRGNREVADWFYFRKEMRSLGVKVVSTMERLGDIYNPADFLQELIAVGMGEHMLLQSRQKSIAGKNVKAATGAFMGGFAPLGYNIVNRKYVINELEAKAVKTIFEMYLQQASYEEIIKAVNDIGVLYGKRGNKISKTTIYSILNNERYTGTFIYNEYTNREMHRWIGKKNDDPIIIEGAIPQIIPKDVFDMVQEKLKSRKRAKNNKREYLLSGLIVCPVCEATMHGKTTKNSKGIESIVYTCPNKAKKLCDSKNIPAEEAEYRVKLALKKWMKNLDVKKFSEDFAVHSLACKDINTDKEEYLKLEKQIFDSKTLAQYSLEQGLFNARQEYLNDIEKLTEKKNQLAEKIAENEQIKIDREQIARQMESALNFITTNITEEKLKEGIQYFIKKIVPREEGLLDVYIGLNMSLDSKKQTTSSEVVSKIGSPGRIRTYDLSVNSRVLHRWATEDYLVFCFSAWIPLC